MVKGNILDLIVIWLCIVKILSVFFVCYLVSE